MDLIFLRQSVVASLWDLDEQLRCMLSDALAVAASASGTPC